LKKQSLADPVEVLLFINFNFAIVPEYVPLNWYLLPPQGVTISGIRGAGGPE